MFAGRSCSIDQHLRPTLPLPLPQLWCFANATQRNATKSTEVKRPVEENLDNDVFILCETSADVSRQPQRGRRQQITLCFYDSFLLYRVFGSFALSCSNTAMVAEYCTISEQQRIVRALQRTHPLTQESNLDPHATDLQNWNRILTTTKDDDMILTEENVKCLFHAKVLFLLPAITSDAAGPI